MCTIKKLVTTKKDGQVWLQSVTVTEMANLGLDFVG